MWSTQLWFLFVVCSPAMCNPVSTSFNANLRDYSVKEDEANSTVRTLQKEDFGRYANFAPIRNPIRFKEIPDNALSSTHSRGITHHDHGAYGFHEYEESPHYGYGFDFDNHDFNHHGGYDYHLGGHHGHHSGHGFHHKHYDHAIAAKTILWPLAGLALLGTAAALVSNPVLLQLGVISGRRRRDVTAESSPDYDFQKWKKEIIDDRTDNNKRIQKNLFKGGLKQGVLLRKSYSTPQSTVESVTATAPAYNALDKDRFIRIPLKEKRIKLE